MCKTKLLRIRNSVSINLKNIFWNPDMAVDTKLRRKNTQLLLLILPIHYNNHFILKDVYQRSLLVLTMCKVIIMDTQTADISDVLHSTLSRSIFPSTVIPIFLSKTLRAVFCSASLLLMNSFSFCRSLKSRHYPFVTKRHFCWVQNFRLPVFFEYLKSVALLSCSSHCF